jgi:hypothetical protein
MTHAGDQIRERARDLLEQGFGPAEVARRVGRSTNWASSLRNEMCECSRCRYKLLRPASLCGFCLVDDGVSECELRESATGVCS